MALVDVPACERSCLATLSMALLVGKLVLYLPILASSLYLQAGP